MTNSLGDQWLSCVRVTARMNQAVERALSERHNLCVSAYEVMDVMWHERGWIRSGELSSRSSRSQPQVSRLLTQMADAGYAARKPSPGDGRGSLVQLTPSGRALFREASATVEDVLADLTAENADAGALMRSAVPQAG
ncbi:MarR family winged helix-turn-helix transcriptional regulator [Streptomyces sp. NPDC017082]|uniref:MarR family winged helix-turn-helix transcriptional regulator n=1 Tax=Streptomyces sp. NPDC017082 TaxID=3364974 RepID=UPI00379D9F0F